MTQQALYTFERPNMTLSGLSVTNVADQSVNNYGLVAAGAPQWEEFSWNGHPAVTFDGVDDTLKQTTGLGQDMIGGTDTPNVVVLVYQTLPGNASGDAMWSCGDNASANPFYRFVVSIQTGGFRWEYRKRDAATGAGSGAGGLGSVVNNAPHIAICTTDGTACTIEIDDVTVFSGAMDVGDMGAIDTFALACLSRNTDSAFCAMRCWAVSIHDALTAGEKRDIYTLYYDKYIGRPANTCGDHFRRRM
jgi:hypothetical protein